MPKLSIKGNPFRMTESHADSHSVVILLYKSFKVNVNSLLPPTKSSINYCNAIPILTFMARVKY